LLKAEELILTPPAPPAPTHRQEWDRLPKFTPASEADRKERARRYLAESNQIIEQLHRGGASGLSVCRLLSEASDRLVTGLWRELSEQLSAPNDLALVALGGYGRRELAPHSDWDLLLLRGEDVDESKTRSLAEALHTLLWDLGRTVGWSSRTPKECAQAAEADHTIRTSLADCRYLTGQESLYQLLTQQVLRDLLSRRADAFIAEKSRELAVRREKYGDSIYLLEPNLKQGDGGLRDLEAALWIAFARFRVRGLRALLQQSVLPRSEVEVLTAARDFLLRIRNQLHFLRQRKEDRLTFDLQEEVAVFLGYQSSEQGLAVEQFMRHYYLSAKAIRHTADALIERCEEMRQRRGPFRPGKRLGPFKVFRGKLTLDVDPELLWREPATILRLFRTADEQTLPLYSWAKDQVVAALPALAKSRADPAVTEELKGLFLMPQTHGQFLFHMHELGALAAVLPEFGRVTALHQHDLYHVYTVDVHTLFAARRLYSLRAGDLMEEEPDLSRQMRDLEDPLPLYLGMLLHDAGKGMGGDHSSRGASLMEQLAQRLLLTPKQRQLADFLVREHLLMSHTAQRRDLSDPHLIAEFAARVGDLERLSCLYLLTYADISSVGPGMWDDWKALLHQELYEKTRFELLSRSGLLPRARPPQEDLVAVARRQFVKGWRSAVGSTKAEAFGRSLPARYFLGTDAVSASHHARLLLSARRQPLAASMRHRREAGFTELTLCAKDRLGLLAQFAGVLSAHRIDILRARIASTSDGLAIDVFDVIAPQGRLLDRARWSPARSDLVGVLTGTATVESVLEKRRTSPLLVRPLPSVPTKISIDNRASQQFTVIDVRAQDRVGLLYLIASSLSELGLEIALAKVATEAHRAIDSFYVTHRGAKLIDSSQLEQTTERLRAAIEGLGGGDSAVRTGARPLSWLAGRAAK
jgi:[protein-PII] uridylyltransferase